MKAWASASRPLWSEVGFDLEARTRAFQREASAQPGCVPYPNHRPIRVRKHSAGQSLRSLLSKVHPFSRSPSLMMEHCRRGWLTVDQKRPKLDQVLCAGNIIRMVIPDTVEPPIAPHLQVLFEDPHLIVFGKPAPLPVHPSGRFNKNTLVRLGAAAWPDLDLKPVHRLDAETTGVLVCGKTVEAARALVAEFRERRVEKQYLARVHGVPAQNRFVIDAPITTLPDRAGTRSVDERGQAAQTDVRLQAVLADGSSVVEVRPRTGRTHQIRLHLQSVGLPIVGDHAYGLRTELQSGFTRAEGRLCLHAHRLGLHHPLTGAWTVFEAPPPAHIHSD